MPLPPLILGPRRLKRCWVKIMPWRVVSDTLLSNCVYSCSSQSSSWLPLGHTFLLSIYCVRCWFPRWGVSTVKGEFLSAQLSSSKWALKTARENQEQDPNRCPVSPHHAPPPPTSDDCWILPTRIFPFKLGRIGTEEKKKWGARREGSPECVTTCQVVQESYN